MPKIRINIRKRVELIDVTADVRAAIEGSGISEGVVHLFVPHTTAAVTINENADPDVARDMIAAVNKLVPFEDNYQHLEGNSAAHVKSSLVGASEFIPVENGRLLLGTWQGVYFFEFDGPRQRTLHIRVLSG